MREEDKGVARNSCGNLLDARGEDAAAGVAPTAANAVLRVLPASAPPPPPAPDEKPGDAAADFPVDDGLHRPPEQPQPGMARGKPPVRRHARRQRPRVPVGGVAEKAAEEIAGLREADRAARRKEKGEGGKEGGREGEKDTVGSSILVYSGV